MDDLFHFNRIQCIADNIKSGQFFSFIYANALNGYGYGSPLFYPDLFLIIPALMTAIGIPIIIAYYIFLLMILCFMFNWCYKLCQKFTDKKLLAYFGALIYVFSVYTYTDVFFRCALGEVLAMAMLPLVALGLYNMLKENFTHPLLLLWGMIGILYSHTISAILITFVVLIISIVNCKKILRDKGLFVKLIVVVLTFLLLAMMYLLPILEAFSVQKYILINHHFVPSFCTLNILELFTSKYSNFWAILLSIILTLFIKKSDENKSSLKWIWTINIINVLLAISTTEIFPWKWFDKVLFFIQFPWRLNIFTTLLLSIVFTMILSELVKIKRARTILCLSSSLVFCIACSIFFIFSNIYVIKNTFYPNYNNIGFGEWIPISTNLQCVYDIDKLNNPNVISSLGQEIEYLRKENTVQLTFYSSSDTEYYDVPLLYYKGYFAIIEANDSIIKCEINKNDYSCLRVYTNGIEGEVTVNYKNTPLQIVGIICTSLTFVAVIIYIVASKRKKLKSK